MSQSAYRRVCGAATPKPPVAIERVTPHGCPDAARGVQPGLRGLDGRTPEPQATEPSLLADAHQQPLVLARREHHVEPDNQHGEVDSIEPNCPGEVVR